MRFFIVFLCCFSILSCGRPQVAVKAPEIKKEESPEALHALTRLLMKKCGINEQIENVPEKTMAEVSECFKRNEEILGRMSGEVMEEINRIIENSFKPDTIRAVIARSIEARLSPSDMNAVIAWLDSPLGQKLTAIEKEGSTPDAYRAMIDFIPKIQEMPDYEERLRLVREIDKSVKATELIVDRMINMQVITLSAMGSAFPNMKLPPEKEIRENLERNRPAITDALSKEMAASILYTYRIVSKQELREYIRFMNSDYGARYHSVIQEGSNEAYTFCGKKFSEAVVARIKLKDDNNKDELPLSKAPVPPVHPQGR